MFFLSSSFPILVFDIITLVFIAALFFFSILSLCFIFHLRLKSQYLPHLQGFNSIWTVRFLLVSFVSLWAIVELLRVPFFRHRYVQPLFPSQQVDKRYDLCKVHVVLSLGFCQPAFLISLLLLVNASIKPKACGNLWPVVVIILICIPMALIHLGLVLFPPFQHQLPQFFKQTTWNIWENGIDQVVVHCTYPLWNTIALCAFGIGYEVWFLALCWRVSTLVINKGLRIRLYGLGSTVLVSLPLQIAFMGTSVMWKSVQQFALGATAFLVFFFTYLCAVVGEGILVIKPIADSLEAGGNCSDKRISSTQPEKNEEGVAVTVGESSECNNV